MPLEPGVSHTGCCFVSFLQLVINTIRQSAERKAVEYSTAERHREKMKQELQFQSDVWTSGGQSVHHQKGKKFLKLLRS